MKETMNKSEVAKFHKMLGDEENEMSLKAIAKELKVTVATLQKFIPEKVKAAAKKHTDRLKASSEEAPTKPKGK